METRHKKRQGASSDPSYRPGHVVPSSLSPIAERPRRGRKRLPSPSHGDIEYMTDKEKTRYKNRINARESRSRRAGLLQQIHGLEHESAVLRELYRLKCEECDTYKRMAAHTSDGEKAVLEIEAQYVGLVASMGVEAPLKVPSQEPENGGLLFNNAEDRFFHEEQEDEGRERNRSGGDEDESMALEQLEALKHTPSALPPIKTTIAETTPVVNVPSPVVLPQAFPGPFTSPPPQDMLDMLATPRGHQSTAKNRHVGRPAGSWCLNTPAAMFQSLAPNLMPGFSEPVDYIKSVMSPEPLSAYASAFSPFGRPLATDSNNGDFALSAHEKEEHK